MTIPPPPSRRARPPVSDDVELEVAVVGPRRTAADPDGDPGVPKGEPSLAILVVDDEPDLRRYVRRSLERPGHPETRVLEAGDGHQALQIMDGTRLDLVITDVVMPGMDGFHLVRAIRESYSPDRLPVLVMTGEGSWREAASEAARVGAQAILSKPFNARKLCDVVAQVLGARAPPAPSSEPETRTTDDPDGGRR